MNDFRILYQNQDGNLAIIVPAKGISIEQAAISVPVNTKWIVVHPSELPQEQEFRNAWRLNQLDEVIIDFEKAKQITKNRLRLQRKPLLDALDIEFIRAIEKGQNTAKIQEEKQRLRDLPDLVEQAKSLQELTELMP